MLYHSLNLVEDLLLEGNFSAAFALLKDELTSRIGADWPKVCSQLRSHSLHQKLLGDPYTARAFVKPRGYAGDAELIDFVYDRKPPCETSNFARKLFDCTTASQNAYAVRLRRELAAAYLDRTFSKGGRVCALACGHLREVDELSSIGRVVAVDQDPASTAVVKERYNGAVHVVTANALKFLLSCEEKFELVYALGLLDYFTDRQARLLIEAGVRRLAKGGRLLVGNFVPENHDRGYMEAAMDWSLILRSEGDLLRLASTVPLDRSVFRERTRNIAFLEVVNSN